MSFDYSKLDGLITEKCYTRSAFSKEIGLSERSISLKMNGKIQWKQDEIYKACKVLSIPIEKIPIYFFIPKVQSD
ncbi:MAG: DUF739 family protein [Ruminococcus sp.]|nr:DUF739 family protein [Ruminococcus sp.]